MISSKEIIQFIEILYSCLDNTEWTEEIYSLSYEWANNFDIYINQLEKHDHKKVIDLYNIFQSSLVDYSKKHQFLYQLPPIGIDKEFLNFKEYIIKLQLSNFNLNSENLSFILNIFYKDRNILKDNLNVNSIVILESLNNYFNERIKNCYSLGIQKILLNENNNLEKRTTSQLLLKSIYSNDHTQQYSDVIFQNILENNHDLYLWLLLVLMDQYQYNYEFLQTTERLKQFKMNTLKQLFTILQQQKTSVKIKIMLHSDQDLKLTLSLVSFSFFNIYQHSLFRMIEHYLDKRYQLDDSYRILFCENIKSLLATDNPIIKKLIYKNINDLLLKSKSIPNRNMEFLSLLNKFKFS
ncbi:hypothetical protein DLAC_06372 [Tieghemostelium lacteum]|uniref:Uncharacterized protein n=1 Tax=Tieghemostelium lacteum TaxID=361077 RepID=A0A151ZEQ7_TIELA|nr:hypothetical protein DLAC_06372 [Tieghemostelium lacteum]|eukprot:KYQ92400.1 hypothetical protein DLAC_06372 [Tieghemostelium lacteum]